MNIEFIFQHWFFIVFSCICAVIVEVEKRILSSKYSLVKKTLPLHPVLLGVLFSLMPNVPRPQYEVFESYPTLALYYAGAGLFSTWIFSVLKSFAKKQGVILEIDEKVEDDVEIEEDRFHEETHDDERLV